MRKRFVQIGFVVLLEAAALFGAAGRLDWWPAWAFLGVYVGCVLVNAALLVRRAPDLIVERATPKEGVKGWDRVLGPIAGGLGLIVALIVAGLDARLGWSGPAGLPVQAAAAVAIALGYLLFGWAMVANRYLSTLVRIQRERGHSVASDGPYRFVRHPSYVGLILTTLATPFLLGSTWALAPAILTVGAVVLRTALEDRTLQAELAGYREYADKTRYRLLPGVW